MPILLVANAPKDTDVEQYLSGLGARSSRRCNVYVRHNAGKHTQPSIAFPFLVCDIESWKHGQGQTNLGHRAWPGSDKPAVILHDATCPDVEEIILETGSIHDSITYLQQIADLLVAVGEATTKQQTARRAASALQIVQGFLARRAGQGSSASSASNTAIATMLDSLQP